MGVNANSDKFGGYLYNAKTGLYYPGSGKYHYIDPVWLNLYNYCHNGPLMYYDPTGPTTQPLSNLSVADYSILQRKELEEIKEKQAAEALSAGWGPITYEEYCRRKENANGKLFFTDEAKIIKSGASIVKTGSSIYINTSITSGSISNVLFNGKTQKVVEQAERAIRTRVINTPAFGRG